MRIVFFFAILFVSFISVCQDEPYLSNQTYTYDQAIVQYKAMAKKYPKYCAYQEFGMSDYGLPISLFLINKSGKFTQKELDLKPVFLINNAIHPGEPEGVDASIKLCKDLLSDSKLIPENVIIAIIPVYNIGGAHNRNCCSRANQNGPLEYGFRGNSKNLDLNRDFIKADSKNTLAFYKIFHTLNPAVFIDTHTSNGADYQYVMTLITSQLNKMNPVLADFVSTSMNPYLYTEMEKKGFPMIPYVTTMKDIPDHGLVDFLETPRYSTGYSNLFNTIGFVAETHMLKSFEQRFQATYDLLFTIIRFMETNHLQLKKTLQKADENLGQTKLFPLNWELDTAQFDSIYFMGFEAEYKLSEVTGNTRLYYNREKPFTKKIRYYNTYAAHDFVERPEYYIIPQAWDVIIPKLQANNVEVFRLNKNLSISAEVYTIIHFETVKGPYEGHYLHHSVEVDNNKKQVDFRVGDYVVPTANDKVRFLVETLEPHAVDSYLAWNYFDAILQQKEWFSAYVFEDEAPLILESNPALKSAFEEKKKNDADFAGSPFAQLYFIYKGSDHYEPSHNQYPVCRIMNEIDPDFLTLFSE